MLQSSAVVAAITQADVGVISSTAVTLEDLGFTAEQVLAADYLEITVSAAVRYGYVATPTAGVGHYLAANVRLRLPPDGRVGGNGWMPYISFIAVAGDADFLITLYTTDLAVTSAAAAPTYTDWEAAVLELDPTPPLIMMALDEASGTTAVNTGSLGVAANGSYVGGVTLAQAGPGGDNAVLLNGTTGYVNFLSDALIAALAEVTAFSFSLWLSADADSVTATREAFTLADTGNVWTLHAYFLDDSGDSLAVGLADGLASDLEDTGVTLPLTGDCISFSYDQEADVGYFYLNGVQVATGSFGITTTALEMTDALLGLDVGGTLFHKGLLARFLLWDKALNGSQLAALGRL